MTRPLLFRFRFAHFIGDMIRVLWTDALRVPERSGDVQTADEVLRAAFITVDGQPVKLRPITMAVLIRLLIAEGAPVTVDRIYQDCWIETEQIFGDYRTQVQKRILEIRRALDPEWSSDSGAESGVLPTVRGRVTAYRLMADRDAADIFAFIDLVAEARRATPHDATGLLSGPWGSGRGRRCSTSPTRSGADRCGGNWTACT